MKTKVLTVGDRVKYKREFLRSIGAYTGDLGFARGEITELKGTKDFMIATIRWDRNNTSVKEPDDLPAKVNTANLAREKAIESV